MQELPRSAHLCFLFVSGEEAFCQEAASLYTEKCARLCGTVEVKRLRSPKLARDQSVQKVREEARLIEKFLRPDDVLMVFDQDGRKPSSESFSELLRERLCRRGRVVLLVGGAFGLSQEIRARADIKIGLSSLILSHEVAQIVVLEQTYRALTIISGSTYHNPNRVD